MCLTKKELAEHDCREGAPGPLPATVTISVIDMHASGATVSPIEKWSLP